MVEFTEALLFGSWSFIYTLLNTGTYDILIFHVKEEEKKILKSLILKLYSCNTVKISEGP